MEPVRLKLAGRIDSANAAATEKELLSQLEGHDGAPVTVDASGLAYISSAGLRVLLHLKRLHPKMTMTGVSSEIYEVLEMTGFTQLINVEKAYPQISVDGCDIIGRGANGTIYRLDADTVVKVYRNAGALDDIRNERDVATLALVLGIPTAISYDIVRVGEQYGSVFELLNARSFAEILAEEPEKTDWCLNEYVGLLKKIHSTTVPAGKLPSMKETVLSWVEFLAPRFPEIPVRKLRQMITDVPETDTLLHGDYHVKNVMEQAGEVLLIDMDTLAVGYPLFELGIMYSVYVGYTESDPAIVKDFLGIDHAASVSFWRRALAAYLGTEEEAVLKSVEDKARIIAYLRTIRRTIRHGAMDGSDGAEEIARWKVELLSLLETTDTLQIPV